MMLIIILSISLIIVFNNYFISFLFYNYVYHYLWPLPGALNWESPKKIKLRAHGEPLDPAGGVQQQKNIIC